MSPCLANRKREKGVALVIVMVVILALTVLVGGLVYSMRVEMKLAKNNNVEAELEWVGRSGVEFAKYVLSLQLQNATEPYDSLNQKWAGGPGGVITNAFMEDYSLENNQVGMGQFSVKIVDLERRININFADQTILQQALIVMGVDAAMSPMVIDSITDWIDPDDVKHLSGAETDYYVAQHPSYVAKNGPIDELSELLMIQGVTPNMYWGPRAASHQNQGMLARSPSQRARQEAVYPVGFVDLFTTLSTKYININTASAEVFQCLLGIDENAARSIITTRAGPDGVDGTQDDVPFRSIGELINVPGISRQAVAAYQSRGSLFVRSATFEVTVAAQVGDVRRDYFAILRRNGPRDVQVLGFWWR